MGGLNCVKKFGHNSSQRGFNNSLPGIKEERQPGMSFLVSSWVTGSRKIVFPTLNHNRSLNVLTSFVREWTDVPRLAKIIKSDTYIFFKSISIPHKCSEIKINAKICILQIL